MSYDKQKVILGLLKISVDGTALGYSRGGSSFTVNRVIHHIAADGDLGDTTNAHILDEERPTLVVNQLVVDPAIFLKLFPAAANSSGTLSPTGKIVSADYHDVVAVAKTKEGKFVRITLNDAINKGNISWTFNDRDEVVTSVTYEATYAERTDLFTYPGSPYTIEFLDSLT